MLLFYCPGCRAEHKANQAFAGRRAQCVRCGAAMRIPATSGLDGVLIPAPDEEPPAAADEEMDIDALAVRDGEEREQYQPDESDPTADEQAAGNPWPRRLGVLAALLAVGVAGYVFTRPGSPPPKPAAKVVPEPEAEEPPPPPPPPTVTPTEFVGPPRPPEEVYAFTADRFMEEHTLGRAAFEERYKGKLVEFQGTCYRLAGGRLIFNNHVRTRDDESFWAAADLPAFAVPDAQRDALRAALGPGPTANLDRPPVTPAPGRPAAVVGRYLGGKLLKNARLLRVTAPADEKYLKRRVTLTGVFSHLGGHEDGTPLFFEPETTTDLVHVECLFRPPLRDALRTIPKGQTVTVTGVCSGRSDFYFIRFDNCTLGGGGDVAANVWPLVREYEADIRPVPPADRTAPPLAVTVEQLSRAYQENPAAADAKYRQKYLAVSGRVLARTPAARQVQFEVETDVKVRVVAAFTPANFARVPADEPAVGVRCVCHGLDAGGVLRLESCEAFDPDDGDPAVPRLTADYFPLKAGAEWTAVRLLDPNPPPEPAKPAAKPAKPPAYSVLRLHYKMAEDGRLVAALVQKGTTPDTAAATAAVKWGAKLPRPTPVQDQRFRVGEAYLEVGTPKVPPPERPKAVQDLFAWAPFLRLGAKPGRDWAHEDAAAGTTTQYRATKFFADARGRPAVRVIATATGTAPKAAGGRQETAMVFVKGVGLVSQKVELYPAEGPSRVVFEEAREEPAAGELRGGPVPP